MTHTLQHALAFYLTIYRTPFRAIFLSVVAEDEKEVLMGHAEERNQLCKTIS